jgi:hypothetical protein
MSLRLRIATSYIFLTLSLATAAIWGHSYYAKLRIANTDQPYSFAIESWKGRLDITERNLDVGSECEPKWHFSVVETEWLNERREMAAGWGPLREPKPFTFNVRKDFQTTRNGRVFYSREITLPLWSIMLATTALAVVLRPSPRRKFKLVEVFICIAIAAVVLTGLDWLMRLVETP